MSAKNYEHALEILKERFGNKQLVISKHMSILLALERIKPSFHIRELRAMYDKIVVNLRALLAFKIDSQQFGPMLIPIVLDKLPAEIKLEISRTMNNKEWDIDELMDILKLEIEARETCNLNNIAKRDILRSHDIDVSSNNVNKNNIVGFTTEQLLVNNYD